MIDNQRTLRYFCFIGNNNLVLSKEKKDGETLPEIKEGKMHKKKIISVLLAFSLIAGTFTGCSPVSFTDALKTQIDGLTQQIQAYTDAGAQGEDQEAGETEFPMDPSVMTPWINSNIMGMVTDEVNAELVDDFYLNINHDYLRDARLRPGYTNEAPYYEASEIVKERCLDIIHDETLTGRDAQLVQDFYELILDWDTRNEIGIKPVMPYVEELEKVETLDQMTEFLLSDLNFTYGTTLAGVGVEMSEEDSSLYQVGVFSTGLSLRDPAEYKVLTENGKRIKKFREGVYSYMLGRAGYSEDEISKLINEMFEFEAKVAQYMKTVLETSSPDYLKESINPVSMDDLKAMSPDYPLTEYMEKRGYAGSKLINLQEPDWLKGLNGLYTEENLEEIKAYLLTHTVGGYITSVDEEAYRTEQELEKALYGIEESTPDEEMAYEMTSAIFSDNMSRIYIDKYLNEEIRQEITTLCQEAADTYSEMLQSVEWLSKETREQAVNKLDNIVIHAVYPDKWEDDSMYHITAKEDGGSFLDAMLNIADASYKQSLTHINGTVDKEIWGINILDTNAYYNPQNNSINIIPGFFCDATYREDMSIEEKYGALGAVIGHEISHAFDTNGAQFDAYGNFKNWWTKEDFAAFMGRAEKLVAYYDKVVAFDDGTPCQGQLIQTEAIADMAGLKCMLKMAERIEGFDYDRFFRAYEYLWAETATIESLEQCAMTDPHPLHYLRGNVTVQQFDEFYQTYGVKEGDGMYLAPEDRIAVW